MSAYNSYTGLWVIPMHRLQMSITRRNITTGAAEEFTVDFTHAIGESTWSFSAITVPDYDTGGVRTVAYDVQVTFSPPYNDFESMIDDLDAISVGILNNVTLILKAQAEQPKGATMTINDDYEHYPIKDWSAFIRTNNSTEIPRLEIVCAGKFPPNVFSYFDVALHRGAFFLHEPH